MRVVYDQLLTQFECVERVQELPPCRRAHTCYTFAVYVHTRTYLHGLFFLIHAYGSVYVFTAQRF